MRVVGRLVVVALVVVGVTWVGAPGAAPQAAPVVVVPHPEVVPAREVVVGADTDCAEPDVRFAIPDLALEAVPEPGLLGLQASMLIPRGAPPGDHEVVLLPESCGVAPGTLTVLSPPDPTIEQLLPAKVGTSARISLGPGTCTASPIVVTVAEVGRFEVVNDLDANVVSSAPFVVPGAPGAYEVTASAEGCTFPPVTLETFVPAALTMTVGTEPGVCASTPTITVPVGTTVHYCYAMTNTSPWPVEVSTLYDDHLGELFTDPLNPWYATIGGPSEGSTHVFPPGETVTSVELGVVASTTVEAPVTSTAVWTTWWVQRCPVVDPCMVAEPSPPARATVEVAPASAPSAEVRPTFTG